MVSFNPWRLSLMKCGVKLVCTHCVKFRHTEVYIIQVPRTAFSRKHPRPKTAHRVKGPLLFSFPLIASKSPPTSRPHLLQCARAKLRLTSSRQHVTNLDFVIRHLLDPQPRSAWLAPSPAVQPRLERGALGRPEGVGLRDSMTSAVFFFLSYVQCGL